MSNILLFGFLATFSAALGITIIVFDIYFLIKNNDEDFKWYKILMLLFFWPLLIVYIIQVFRKQDSKKIYKIQNIENIELSLKEKLKEIENLYDKKIITKEEYDSKRKKLLDKY